MNEDERREWRRRMQASRLSSAAKLVWELHSRGGAGHQHDEVHNLHRFSQAKIAKALNKSEESVRRSYLASEQERWVQRHSGDHTGGRASFHYTEPGRPWPCTCIVHTGLLATATKIIVKPGGVAPTGGATGEGLAAFMAAYPQHGIDPWAEEWWPEDAEETPQTVGFLDPALYVDSRSETPTPGGGETPRFRGDSLVIPCGAPYVDPPRALPTGELHPSEVPDDPPQTDSSIDPAVTASLGALFSQPPAAATPGTKASPTPGPGPKTTTGWELSARQVAMLAGRFLVDGPVIVMLAAMLAEAGLDPEDVLDGLPRCIDCTTNAARENHLCDLVLALLERLREESGEPLDYDYDAPEEERAHG